MRNDKKEEENIQPLWLFVDPLRHAAGGMVARKGLVLVGAGGENFTLCREATRYICLVLKDEERAGGEREMTPYTLKIPHFFV